MRGLSWGIAAAVALTACTGRYVRPTNPEPFEATPERLIRGEYLVRNVLACGACHAPRASRSLDEDEDLSAPLSGGNLDEQRGMRLWVPNLTPDAETGLGRWTDDQLARSLRDGVRPDGSLLTPAMPFPEYQWLSDSDVRAVVVYLRSVQPAKPPSPREANRLPFFADLFLVELGVAHHEPVHSVEEPNPAEPLAYGQYLARVSGCIYCHSRKERGEGRPPGDPLFMAGSEGPFEGPRLGKVWATNLTPDAETGLGRVSGDQIKQALKTGLRLDGKTMAPPMRQFRAHYAGMVEADLDALVAYLKSLPPVRRAVPPRQLAPQMAERLGGP